MCEWGPVREGLEDALHNHSFPLQLEHCREVGAAENPPHSQTQT